MDARLTPAVGHLMPDRSPRREPITLVFEDVEVDGRQGRRVGIAGQMVAFVEDAAADGVGVRRPRLGATVIDGGGGALLPGLHDHHLHLLSMAARARSVPCGPPEVRDRAQLARQLQSAASDTPPGRWVRGYGYDDTATGALDGAALDELLGEQRHVLVRVQHRSGHQWVLNRAGAALVSRRGGPGNHAVGTGVFDDVDDELRGAWLDPEPPPLDAVGRILAEHGVTGATDATVGNGASELSLFEEAQRSGSLPQRLHVLGGELPARGGHRLTTGARKVVLSEHHLPELDELVATVAGAGGRGVAIHCVSREALVLALAAIREAGAVKARIEHAAVSPPEVVELLRALDVTVVTQPGFVHWHGDRYRREVEAGDLPWLYRLRAWRAVGIHLAGSSDAPFGDPDPWAAMRAAVDRRTAAGAVLGPDEGLSPEEALDLYLSPLEDPAAPPRRVEAGAPADLCLLSVPWRLARHELDARLVRATCTAGSLVACR